MKNYVFLQGDKFCYTVELDENYVDNFNLMESLEKKIANAEALIKNSKSIEISRGIEELRDNCFGNFEKANTIYIPDTIKRIDNSIFTGSDCSIQKIHIAKEVFASNYSKLEKIFGEKFEDKIVLENLYFRDEKIQAAFNEYKDYGQYWSSKDKYSLYKQINERVNSDSLRNLIINNDAYKELDSKFVNVFATESIWKKEGLTEGKKEFIDILVRATDGIENLNEKEIEVFKEFFEADSKNKQKEDSADDGAGL